MGNNYILEAFKEFDLLEDTENEFPLDPAGMEDLSSFLDYAGEDEDNYVDVIDLEAEAEEELKQSYVGKVILDCNICHSHVFLDRDEIQIDDEGNVNIETECPYCMSTEGFNIIGEVKPYEDEAEEEEEPIEEPIEEKPVDGEPEVEEEPIDEEPGVEEEPIEESLKESTHIQKDDAIRFRTIARELNYLLTHLDLEDDDNEYFEEADLMRFAETADDLENYAKWLEENNLSESLKKKSLKEGFWKHFEADEQYPEEWCFVQSEGSMSPECSIVKHGADSFEIRSSAGRHVDTVDSLAAAQTKAASVFDLGLAEDFDGQVAGAVAGKAVGSAVAGPVGGLVGGAIGGKLGDKLTGMNEDLGYVSLFDLINWMGDHEQAAADIESYYGKSLEEMNTDEILDWIYDHDQLASDFERYFGVNDVMSANQAREYWDANRDSDPVLAGYDGDFDAWYKDSVENGYIIESVIDVDTENDSTIIETEDKLIKVEDNEQGGKTITTEPLDDSEEEYEAPDEVIAPLDLGDEAEIIDNVEATDFDDLDEEPVEEEPLEDEEFPADDFDEESFDELGESYLRKCYENVTSFKTTNVELKDNDLIIEGAISFDSGNKKKTSFRFNLKESKNGKAYFTGLNEQISKGEKSFNLRCKVVDRKLHCEALRYNYKAQNELNESVKVYGTVRRNLTEAKRDLPIRKALQDANVLSTLDKDPKGTIKKAIEVVKASPDISDKDKADFERAMRGSQNKALSSLATYAFDINKATLR